MSQGLVPGVFFLFCEWGAQVSRELAQRVGDGEPGQSEQHLARFQRLHGSTPKIDVDAEHRKYYHGCENGGLHVRVGCPCS